MNSPETMPLCQEQAIRDKIAELKSQLPEVVREPSTPLHAVLSTVFLDGATHTRSVDAGTEWKKVCHRIKDALRQGAEVVIRPMYPGEEPSDRKDYPSTRRIAALEALVVRVVRLNPEAGEIGPGMLASLVEEARGLMAGKDGAA